MPADRCCVAAQQRTRQASHALSEPIRQRGAGKRRQQRCGIVNACRRQGFCGAGNQSNQMVGAMAERGMVERSVRFADLDWHAAQQRDYGPRLRDRLRRAGRHGETRAHHLLRFGDRIASEGHGRMDSRGTPALGIERGQYPCATASADMEGKGRRRSGNRCKLMDARFERIVRDSQNDQIAPIAYIGQLRHGTGPAD